MKDGIIKITGETDLFYDSISKQYKYRMHCPRCNHVSGIFCFEDWDTVSMCDDEEYPNYYCTNRCFVLDNKDDVRDIAESLGISIKSSIEEWNASKITRILKDEVDDYDYDIPGGYMCMGVL